MSKLKHNSWIVILPLAAGAITYVMLFFLPGMKAIADVRQQMRTQQDYLAQAERLRQTLNDVRKTLADTDSYNADWQERLPDASRLPVLFGEISRLAKASGATTTRFEPQPPVKHKTLQKVPLALAVSGEFAAVTKLLKSLEELAAVVWVEDLKLNGTGQDGKNVSCELSIAIFTGHNEKSD